MSIKELINIVKFHKNNTKIHLEANNEELEELKDILEISKVNAVIFEAKITKVSTSNIFAIKGILTANITQECARTLEEINTNLKVDIYRLYEQISKSTKTKKDSNIKNLDITNYNKEIIINLDDEEINLFNNDEISFEELIREELLLEIDPYIKKD